MAETTEKSILSFIGLAQRAMKVVSGNDAVIAELRNGTVELLIVARDVSDNTYKKLVTVANKLEFDCPSTYKFSDMRSLGQAIGKPDRALLAITDKGFAGKLKTMLEGFDYKEESN